MTTVTTSTLLQSMPGSACCAKAQQAPSAPVIKMRRVLIARLGGMVPSCLHPSRTWRSARKMREATDETISSSREHSIHSGVVGLYQNDYIVLLRLW